MNVWISRTATVDTEGIVHGLAWLEQMVIRLGTVVLIPPSGGRGWCRAVYTEGRFRAVEADEQLARQGRFALEAGV